MNNESYELAEQWVVKQIDDELRDKQVRAGSIIHVGGLADCDCIPINVTDCRKRKWDLQEAHRGPHRGGRHVYATYRSQ